MGINLSDIKNGLGTIPNLKLVVNNLNTRIETKIDSIESNISFKTTNYSITYNDYILIFTLNAAATATLPLITAQMIGKIFKIFNNSAASRTLSIARTSPNLLNGSATSLSVPKDGTLTIRAVNLQNWIAYEK